jgi:hypothetical protein
MARFVDPLITSGFATGVLHYIDHYPGYEHINHMVLPVRLADRLSVLAILDTGSTWCIFDPELMGLINDAIDLVDQPEEQLLIRGTRYRGRLVVTDLQFDAASGAGLRIAARIFVPELAANERWRLPNFLGLDGLLQYIRFANDPADNAFYFGPV